MERQTKPSFPPPRRSFTAPVSGPPSGTPAVSSSPTQPVGAAGGLVETLYNHPNVKIISFTAGRARARSPGRALPEEEPGSLSPSSQLERTIAVGPFRIYRAPGSVAFLNCGNALQPILPRSQCWCIDETSSKFILQIRRPQYWRIEVPVNDAQERDLAHGLPIVLGQVLQFEKTLCPFQRSFTVQLPEKPEASAKKKPWKPVRRSLPPLSTPDAELSPSDLPAPISSRRGSWGPRARSHTPTTPRDDSPVVASPAANTIKEEEAKDVDNAMMSEEGESEPKSLRARHYVVGKSVEQTEALDSTGPLEHYESIEKEENVDLTETTGVAGSSPEPVRSMPVAGGSGGAQTTDCATRTDVRQGADEPELLVEADTLPTDARPTGVSQDNAPEEVGEQGEPASEVNMSLEEPDLIPEGLAKTENIAVQTSDILQTEESPAAPLSAHSSSPTETEGSPNAEPQSTHSISLIDHGGTDVTTATPEDAPGDIEGQVSRPLTPTLDAVVTDNRPATPKQSAPRNESPNFTINLQIPEESDGDRGRAPIQDEASEREESAEDKRKPRTDIYDVIRAYEEKTAAGTLTSLDVASAAPFIAESADEDALHEDESSALTIGDQTTTVEDEAEIGDEIHEGSGIVGDRRKKLRGFRGSRSLVVPPQLTLVTSPPSKSARPRPPPPSAVAETKEPASPTGSTDSFHSVQSWHSAANPLPPSPPASRPTTPSTFPYPHDNIEMPRRLSSHNRELSDLTVTPGTRGTWDVVSTGTSSNGSQESAATAPDVVPDTAKPVSSFPGKDTDKTALSEDEAVSSSIATRRSQARHRPATSNMSNMTVSRRALSPLPPAANLFSPTTPSASGPRRDRRDRRDTKPGRSRLELVRRMPMAIVAKTCEILLSPPSHLINLMLRVAARIAAGEWRGMVFGYDEGGEPIPVRWDYSDGELSDWGDDDDYYMSSAASVVETAESVASEDERDDANRTERSWSVD